MERVYNALVESTILMGLLILMFGGTACYMWATGQEVPEALVGLITLFAGFWLRSKAGVEVRKTLGVE